MFIKDPVAFSYPPKKALRMGLVQSRRSSTTSTARTRYTPTSSSVPPDDPRVIPEGVKPKILDQTTSQTRKSIYERRLHVYTEGLLGKILLLDADEQGKFQANSSGFTVFMVHDALTSVSILDIKHLLGNEKKLHIA